MSSYLELLNALAHLSITNTKEKIRLESKKCLRHAIKTHGRNVLSISCHKYSNYVK
jgi:hypothetical protein